MKLVVKASIVVFFFSFFTQSIFAQCDDCPQEKKKKPSVYLLWGYNKDWYTKSTIRFRNPTGEPDRRDQYGIYDFTIYNAKAHDRTDFDLIKDVVNISVPQFSTRLGIYFNDKKDQGFELNYDHAKYVVYDWQTVRIKGSAFGESFDKDTILNPAYIHFEHTDGANFMLFNYMKRWKFYYSKDRKTNLGIVIKPGIGFVYPRTDVTIFSNRLNNNWHVAGTCIGFETGIRGEFWKYFTVEFTGKLVGAYYSKCLVQGKGHGKASHKLGCAEAILCFGFNI